mmetsp:Transcript_8313/g.13529  ORF Transcript_8313/g.13529 Transcript_8313/m.13529 type:complete len:220 (-) Transcript_8313:3589-4248(-)
MKGPIGLDDFFKASMNSSFHKDADTVSGASEVNAAFTSFSSIAALWPPGLKIASASTIENFGGRPPSFRSVQTAFATKELKSNFPEGATRTYTLGSNRLRISSFSCKLSTSGEGSGPNAANFSVQLTDMTLGAHLFLNSSVTLLCCFLMSSSFLSNSSGSVSSFSCSAMYSSLCASSSRSMLTMTAGFPKCLTKSAASLSVFGYLASTSIGNPVLSAYC